MNRNYYSFNLNDIEYIFFTYRNLSQDEVLEYAECYSFIKKQDIPKCNNVRKLGIDEINERNKELYKKWWNDREEKILNGEDISDISIPPRLKIVQLD